MIGTKYLEAALEKLEESINGALEDNNQELSEHWVNYLEDNITDDETWLVEAECLKNVRVRLFEMKRLVEDIKEQTFRLYNILDNQRIYEEENK